MIETRLIEKIEGEAVVRYDWDDRGISDAVVTFPHTRGVESILTERPVDDALVITPRVCGICGHSHLIAAVRALESLYAANGAVVTLSPKARAIRSLTLAFEHIQNHFKWLYLVMAPRIAANGGAEGISPLKALPPSAAVTRAIAVLGGQWPHTSYAVAGGVTCDPTTIDLVLVRRCVDEVIRYFEMETAGSGLDRYLAIETCDELLGCGGDFPLMAKSLVDRGIGRSGDSHSRYLVLGDNPLAPRGRSVNGKVLDVYPEHVREDDRMTVPFGGETYAKNALYKGQFYEVGPLARAAMMRRPLIRQLKRAHGFLAARFAARVHEIALLLDHCRVTLESIDTGEPSWIAPSLSRESLSGTATGVCEAPRGSLIHTVRAREGRILSYDIITPTQWNLGQGSLHKPSTIQKGLIGLPDVALAELVFRSFDVCSVCTTQ